MEHLRARFWSFVAKVRSEWTRLKKRHWLNEPEEDIFRSAKLLLAIGGIKFEPKKQWQRICWKCYHLLGVCQLLVVFLCFVEHLMDKTDIVATILFLISTFALLAGWVEQLAVRHRWDSIQRSAKFLNRKPASSKDPANDSAIRTKLFQKIQLLSLGLTAVIIFCMIMIPILVFTDNRFLRFPRMLQPSDEMTHKVLYSVFMMPLFPYWVVKKLSPTVMTTALLSGFEAEIRILTDGLKRQPQPQQDGYIWQRLNEHVRVYTEQHTRLVENLWQLRPVVSMVYLTVYYNAMIISGSATYIVVTERPAFDSIFYIVYAVTYGLECFWWSFLAESFGDICESFEEAVLDLLTEILQQDSSTSALRRLRTSLMITKINAGRCAQLNCAALLDISFETYGELLDTIYTLLTFLLEVANPRAV